MVTCQSDTPCPALQCLSYEGQLSPKVVRQRFQDRKGKSASKVDGKLFQTLSRAPDKADVEVAIH